MKARVERDWMSHNVKVWLYDESTRGTEVIRHGSEGWGREVLTPGIANVPPSLTIPEQALAALVAEASGILPASDATSAHLADAVVVRDRLLSLVERSLEENTQ